ncbi:hypothetical protein [Streptomyces sp. NBC_01363]|uniref:hypothetical protein n=1 Tax=Streptomyces sp. NBC_01363 TaxID=2903840 RepID=UPI002254DC03|nr:hypothetical protein [Streptomyces sp. NBC_01363]MCX4734385.1 hypothetical protein [Streptomyces sp. NBC_01363]
MVNARTYPLWRDLAMSEDLPKEALRTVIEALCAPATTPVGFDSRADQWREDALKAALPALLVRTSAKRLRGRLLVHGDEKMLATLAAEGTVTPADVPAILRTRRVWAGLIAGLARHPGQVDAAIHLLPRLPHHEVEHVVRDWDLDRYTRAEGDAPAPPLPQELFDAVLEACLTPLAAYLLHPEPEEGWEAVSAFAEDWSLELGGHNGWAMLARCPERWAELAAHPVFGAAVQHLLLDQAEIKALEDARLHAATNIDSDSEELPAEDPAPALSEDLLLACLPALCLPELAELPNPQVTARRTLHHIARRVRNNPRLTGLAADRLQAAADVLVVRGQLLSLSEKQAGDYGFDGSVRRLAEDLALLSTNPDHLAGACAQLALLDQPAVVSSAPSRTLIRVVDSLDADYERPARLLERHSEHRRGQALATLATNPHTPHAAVGDVLDVLHPAELAWIAENVEGPDWFLNTAASLPTPEDEDDGVLRLLSDDELAQHPTPRPSCSPGSTPPPPVTSSPAPRSTGPSSNPATTPWSTCARSPPTRSSPATNPTPP